MAVLIRNANIFLVELCLHDESVAEFNHILKIIRNLNPAKPKKTCHSDCRPTSMVIFKFIQLLITVIQVSHGISRYLFFIQAQLISNFFVPGPWLTFGRIGLDPRGHKSADTSTIWPKENGGKMLESKLLGKVGKLMKITYELPRLWVRLEAFIKSQIQTCADSPNHSTRSPTLGKQLRLQDHSL